MATAVLPGRILPQSILQPHSSLLHCSALARDEVELTSVRYPYVKRADFAKVSPSCISSHLEMKYDDDRVIRLPCVTALASL